MALNLGTALIVLGLLIAMSRGPLLLAPLATRRMYLSFCETNSRIRWVGLLLLLLAVYLLASAWGTPGLTAEIIRVGAVAIGVFVGVIMVLLPGVTRSLIARSWGKFGSGSLRFIGALSLVAALALIWWGMQF